MSTYAETTYFWYAWENVVKAMMLGKETNLKISTHEDVVIW